MILIGKQAEKMNQEQWERMSLLSGHFLDVLKGITTLKVFGRAKDQYRSLVAYPMNLKTLHYVYYG